jgi:hypothetical protein
MNYNHPSKKTITIDALHFIDIAKLRPKAAPSVGYKAAGTISISHPAHELDVHFALEILNTGKGTIRLLYIDPVSGRALNYEVALDTTPAYFGGYRLWFICPDTGARAVKLYLNPQDGFFVSRHALRSLGGLYASQIYGDYDRAIAMKNKTARRLSMPCPLKPKGMHYRTYERILSRYEHYHGKCQKIIANQMDRFAALYHPESL